LVILCWKLFSVWESKENEKVMPGEFIKERRD